MSNNTALSLLDLPIELIFRILDRLAPVTLLLSVRNVCKRLDQTTDVYHPYQVNLTLHSSTDFHRRRSTI